MQAVKDCDILIAVSNGNAGWADAAGAIGICHAELMTGLVSAPAKVGMVAVQNVQIAKDEGARNECFQKDVAGQSLFRGGTVKTVGNLRHEPASSGRSRLKFDGCKNDCRQFSIGRECAGPSQVAPSGCSVPMSNGELAHWSDDCRRRGRSQQLERAGRDIGRRPAERPDYSQRHSAHRVNMRVLLRNDVADGHVTARNHKRPR